MKEDNKVWVIMWGYWDGSAFGVVGNIAYDDWQTAQHIQSTLTKESTEKKYTLVELGVVQGELK